MDDIVERITAVATAEKMTAEQVLKIVVAYTLLRSEMKSMELSEYILQDVVMLNGAELNLLGWVARSQSRPLIESICNDILSFDQTYDAMLPVMFELDVEDHLAQSLMERLAMIKNGRFAKNLSRRFVVAHWFGRVPSSVEADRAGDIPTHQVVDSFLDSPPVSYRHIGGDAPFLDEDATAVTVFTRYNQLEIPLGGGK